MNFGADKTSGEDGIRLFRRIHGADPELPVLLITAWASLETAVQLVKEGASDYLAKPWDDEKLVLSVQNLPEDARGSSSRTAACSEGGARPERRWPPSTTCAAWSSRATRCTAWSRWRSTWRASDAPVLVTGPSGAGKEKLAEIVQANSRRAPSDPS